MRRDGTKVDYLMNSLHKLEVFIKRILSQTESATARKTTILLDLPLVNCISVINYVLRELILHKEPQAIHAKHQPYII